MDRPKLVQITDEKTDVPFLENKSSQLLQKKYVEKFNASLEAWKEQYFDLAKFCIENCVDEKGIDSSMIKRLEIYLGPPIFNLYLEFSESSHYKQLCFIKTQARIDLLETILELISKEIVNKKTRLTENASLKIPISDNQHYHKYIYFLDCEQIEPFLQKLEIACNIYIKRLHKKFMTTWVYPTSESLIFQGYPLQLVQNNLINCFSEQYLLCLVNFKTYLLTTQYVKDFAVTGNLFSLKNGLDYNLARFEDKYNEILFEKDKDSSWYFEKIEQTKNQYYFSSLDFITKDIKENNHLEKFYRNRQPNVFLNEISSVMDTGENNRIFSQAVIKDQLGNTLLHYALKKYQSLSDLKSRYFSIITLLCSHGASFSVANNELKIPIKFAKLNLLHEELKWGVLQLFLKGIVAYSPMVYAIKHLIYNEIEKHLALNESKKTLLSGQLDKTPLFKLVEKVVMAIFYSQARLDDYRLVTIENTLKSTNEEKLSASFKIIIDTILKDKEFLLGIPIRSPKMKHLLSRNNLIMLAAASSHRIGSRVVPRGVYYRSFS